MDDIQNNIDHQLSPKATVTFYFFKWEVWDLHLTDGGSTRNAALLFSFYFQSSRNGEGL